MKLTFDSKASGTLSETYSMLLVNFLDSEFCKHLMDLFFEFGPVISQFQEYQDKNVTLIGTAVSVHQY